MRNWWKRLQCEVRSRRRRCAPWSSCGSCCPSVRLSRPRTPATRLRFRLPLCSPLLSMWATHDAHKDASQYTATFWGIVIDSKFLSIAACDTHSSISWHSRSWFITFSCSCAHYWRNFASSEFSFPVFLFSDKIHLVVRKFLSKSNSASFNFVEHICKLTPYTFFFTELHVGCYIKNPRE